LNRDNLVGTGIKRCSPKEVFMPLQKQCLDGEQVFVIPQFLSGDECEHLIVLSETLGYCDAPITTPAGFVMQKDVRDNLRVMHDNTEMATQFYLRLEPFLVKTIEAWQASGLNERWRFYRYDVGQTFRPHYDGCYRRSDIEESLFTFMIYLDEDFEGGETNFYHEDGQLRLTVEPSRGMALIFWHNQLHEGAPVLKGRKYVVRSDVMYRRVVETPSQ
jgi:predicted 2-oxoglutarate/Fe(II)-dependent dioxygenase YbiX